MDVYVNGKQKIRLTPADFKAQGGEGSVYVRTDTAYKIYRDPAQMVPPAKIAELGVLGRPEVIKPRDVLFDASRNAVGYTMQHVADGMPLCRIFTRTFRDRYGVDPDIMLRLIRGMQATIDNVHQSGVLLVDLNETNFLVDSKFKHTYFIDVDSYQTPSYPATAIMDSIRDRHSATFSPETDWFSFAIVSFQMFVGIHPYKGKHASLTTMEQRMMANVSVLSSGVAVPAACLPFSVIPPSYRAWYEAVLNKGARVAPPRELNDAIMLPAQYVVTPRLAQAGGGFEIEELRDCPAAIVAVIQGLIVTAAGVVSGPDLLLSGNVRIAVAPQSQRPMAAWIDGNRARFYDIDRQIEFSTEIAAEEMMATDGRVYIKNADRLLEIDFLEFGKDQIRVVATPIANVLPNATQLFDGVVIQNLLDACYVSLLPARGRCRQVRMDELSGKRIIDARYEDGVLMVITEFVGRYDRWIFRFDASVTGTRHYSTPLSRASGLPSGGGAGGGSVDVVYDVRHQSDVTTTSVNFTVLATGICLHITDGDELELFSKTRGATGLKVLTDPSLDGACRLFHNGSQALFARDNKLFKFSMRKAEVTQ